MALCKERVAFSATKSLLTMRDSPLLPKLLIPNMFEKGK